LSKRYRKGKAGEVEAPPKEVAQATLRLRSELECERVVRLAHARSIASATAYRAPEDGAESPIFLMLVDEPEAIERFLPELKEAAPEAPVSVIREGVAHVSPHDFLRGGVLAPKPFGASARQVGWVFAGGSLGAGARLLVETGASYVTPFHSVFPWGTMLVNVFGSFGIAVFGALLFERFVGERERTFWVLGFLGSFTTFSSFALQTSQSWEASPILGSLYGGGSVVLGLAAALLGLRLTRGLM
jgi:CrcB protein